MMLTKAVTDFVAVAVEQMLANGGFAACFFGGVDDFVAAAGEDFVEVIGGAMKFLRAEDEVDIGQVDRSVPARGFAPCNP